MGGTATEGAVCCLISGGRVFRRAHFFIPFSPLDKTVMLMTSSRRRMIQLFALFCFTALAIASLAIADSPSTDTQRPSAGNAPKRDRKAICNSDTDCVTLNTMKGSKLRIDDLDFDVDTVETMLTKIPSWFGPARPIHFIHRGRLLQEGIPLQEFGIEVGDEVQMYKAGAWHEEL